MCYYYNILKNKHQEIPPEQLSQIYPNISFVFPAKYNGMLQMASFLW